MDDQVWRYPPGRWTQLAVGVLLLFTFWAHSAPAGGYSRWTRLAGILWLLIGAYYGLRLVSAAIARRSIHFATRGSWLVVPLLGALALVLVKTNASFEARFWVSRDAMDAAAQRVLAQPKAAAQIDRIGLWPTSRVESFRSGMRFLIDASGSGDRFGFAYSPRGRPPDIRGRDSYSHLNGPWYVWVTSSAPSQAQPLRRRAAKPVQHQGAATTSRRVPSPRALSTPAGARPARAQVVAAAVAALRVHRVDFLAPAMGGDLAGVVAVVSKPDARRHAGTYCHAHWAHLGLTIVLVAQSSLDPCGRGRVVGGFATGRQWRTHGGLRVGASLRELRRLYPTTRSVGFGWWRLLSIGAGSSPVPLHAHVSKGRVDVLLLN